MTAWDLNLGSGEARLGDEQILRVHPDDAGRVDSALRRTIAGEAAFDIEYRLAATGGTTKMVSNRAVVLRDDQGRAARVLGIRTDITDRKRVQETLRENQERMVATGNAIRRLRPRPGHGPFRLVARNGVVVRTGCRGLRGTSRLAEAGTPRQPRRGSEEQMEEAAITGHYSADYRIIRPDGEVVESILVPRSCPETTAHWRGCSG